MEPVSFFGRFVQKVKVSCFSESFVQKTTQQKGASAEASLRTGGKMAAVMLQVIPSFYTNYSKNSVFVSANTYEKFIVSKEYCIARHDDKMGFLTNCRYHNILLGNIKDLLQKLDAVCFNYQHVDCLYTLFKYRFSSKLVVKSGQLFDYLQRAVHLNQQNRRVDRHREKETLEEKVQKTFVELLPKDQFDAN